MVLFVGYPISYETACDFLKIYVNVDSERFDEAMKETGLEFYYVDKGQYIFGLKVDIGDLHDDFVSVDDSLIRILQQKKKVVELIKKAGIDLSDFMIQPIGHEAFQRVFNPQPYLITCG